MARRVRPPKWDTLQQPRVLPPLQLEPFKRQQQKTLARFRELAEHGRWSKLHNDHFFPIDDGSKAQYNVRCEADVAQLLADQQWADGYGESVRLCARAWGWDVDAAARIEPLEAGMGWTHWDVRLAKIIRSLWLFQHPLFGSVQAFARALSAEEKRGEPFQYGGINLDEILWMVPRVAPEAKKRPREPVGAASPSGSRDGDAPAAEPAAPAAPAAPASDLPGPLAAPSAAPAPASEADAPASASEADAPVPPAAPAEAPAPRIVHHERDTQFALAHADGSTSRLEYKVYTSRRASREAPRADEEAREGAELVVMDIWHTETPAAHRGKGSAAALTAAAFDLARARGWRVRPSCSYVSGTFLPKHPELAPLVWADGSDDDETLKPV